MPSDYALKQRKAKLYASPVAAVVQPVKVALGKFDAPLPGYVWGMDLSHWSGVWNFDKAKLEGCSFVILKYMDGKLRTRFARENYRGATDAGMLVGSYQWLRSVKEGISPAGQAREYLRMLNDYPVDIRPCVDFESSPRGKKYNADQSDLWSFRLAFREGYGSEPMIYTSWGYWTQYGSQSPSWIACPFWQARYGKSTLNIKPWGDRWEFWQYTEGGDGIKYGSPRDGEKSVDMNVWHGTMAELNAFCGVDNA
jgi:GH25 family lysozyme M1 (1,4-beta-N-acetylmuramidase)